MPVAFMKSRNNQCRFPLGEGVEMMVCGEPKQAGSSYCPACHAHAYEGARKVKRAFFRDHSVVSSDPIGERTPDLCEVFG